MRISKLNDITTEIEENYEEDGFELEIENMPEEEFGKSDSPAVLLSKERVKYMDFQEWNELNRYHFRRLLEALIDGRVQTPNGYDPSRSRDWSFDWDTVEEVYAERCRLRWARPPITANLTPHSAPAPEQQSIRQIITLSSRRGRPIRHKWVELMAATVERCLRGPISMQEALVREMPEWCIEHWGEEPALSNVRGYVAPIFQQFEAHWKKRGATGLAEKSESVARDVTGRDFSAGSP